MQAVATIAMDHKNQHNKMTYFVLLDFVCFSLSFLWDFLFQKEKEHKVDWIKRWGGSERSCGQIYEKSE